MTTLKDVAQLAHVSASTVSRAINNTSYVHPETKERILKAITELSYHPNLIVKGLQKGKYKIIGLIVPSTDLTIYSDLIPIIQKCAVKHGYQTIISVTNDNPETEKSALNHLRHSFVDGLIIAGTGGNNHLLRDIVASGIPVVQLLRYQEETLGGVGADYIHAAMKAVEFLYQTGSRGIGLLNGSKLLAPFAKRYFGYHNMIKKVGLQENFICLPDINSSYFDFGYQKVIQLIHQSPETDAILVGNDCIGLGVLKRLKEMHKKVPKDYRLISLAGYKLGKYLETPLSSVELPLNKIGKNAVEAVIGNIEGNFDVMYRVYAMNLVLRASC